MRILTLHLALTYPNHCPTSCRTNNHFKFYYDLMQFNTCNWTGDQQSTVHRAGQCTANFDSNTVHLYVSYCDSLH